MEKELKKESEKVKEEQEKRKGLEEREHSMKLELMRLKMNKEEI